MTLWRPRGSYVMGDDDWEGRAIALASRVEDAAAELRSLIAEIRKDSLGEEEEDDERSES
jgi:class 3 adenylate cyclase